MHFLTVFVMSFVNRNMSFKEYSTLNSKNAYDKIMQISTYSAINATNTTTGFAGTRKCRLTKIEFENSRCFKFSISGCALSKHNNNLVAFRNFRMVKTGSWTTASAPKILKEQFVRRCFGRHRFLIKYWKLSSRSCSRQDVDSQGFEKSM